MKVMIAILFSLIILMNSFAFGQNTLENHKLEAGVGIVDISGKGAIIIDPLHVKAIVFRQGAVQVALVACDVIGVRRSTTYPARKKAALKTGIPFSNITVAATHTHMASEHTDLESAVVKAIEKAQANLRPVTLTSALGQQFDVSYNRRYFMKDGSVVFNPMFLNPDIVRPAGPIDPDVGVVLLNDSEDGTPLMSIVNFALHLDTVKEYGAVYQEEGVGSPNAVSADYPYWIEEFLREDNGDEFNSIFFMGTAGNINHWDFSRPGPQSGHKTTTRMIGDSLAVAIRRALPEGTLEAPALATRSRTLQIPLQHITEEDVIWAQQLDDMELSGRSEEPDEREQFLNSVRQRRILWLNDQKQKGNDTLPIDVQVFRLSDNTAVVALAGEIFVEHGLTLKNFSPFENTIIITLANDTIAYVPNKKAFAQGGYEVENSRLAPGGGEMMIEAALQMLRELEVDAQ